ncbi:MAG TPA: hypothetical protein VF203_07990 [Burkholderiales bacterium]
MRLPSLQQFFRHQLHHAFRTCGLSENGTVDYVSEVLARFAHTRLFHALRDAEGRPLEYIVDMLAAWQQAQESATGRRDYARERAIARHIGDYTLFMSGLFRERLRARGELEYYISHGRSAFWRSADYEVNPARRETYRRLYHEFNPISDILDYLRRVQLPLQGRAGSTNLLAAYWRV